MPPYNYGVLHVYSAGVLVTFSLGLRSRKAFHSQAAVRGISQGGLEALAAYAACKVDR